MPPAVRSPQTREKLLQATHELLDERAGAEPSVAQICERAGVQVAMVSYCFGGKAGLLEALVERTCAGVIEELDRLAAMDLPPDEKLRLHVAAMVRNFVKYPYVHQLSERLVAGEHTAERMASLFAKPTLAFYRDLLATGAFRPGLDPTLLFFSVVGACEFLFAARSWLAEGAGETLDEALVERFTTHTIELVLHGIAA
jgi:AcrR family transcriptional regulator